jgi:HEAT repeat protein
MPLFISRILLICFIAIVPATAATAHHNFQNQAQALTPLQLEIEKQRSKLSSGDVEERREALVRLRSLQHSEASRAALAALSDSAPIVRATAAAAIFWLPAAEGAQSLIPLLNDKDEFVRQQVSYALGRRGNGTAVAALVERLTDKKDSVRGAAAVSLGEIADAQALPGLLALLDPPTVEGSKKKKSKREVNPFVIRAAVHALGQIGNRNAAPTLIAMLQEEKTEPDIRREAAIALGAIGDGSALPALRSVVAASDPYLAQTAHDAIKKISQK